MYPVAHNFRPQLSGLKPATPAANKMIEYFVKSGRLSGNNKEIIKQKNLNNNYKKLLEEMYIKYMMSQLRNIYSMNIPNHRPNAKFLNNMIAYISNSSNSHNVKGVKNKIHKNMQNLRTHMNIIHNKLPPVSKRTHVRPPVNYTKINNYPNHFPF